MAKHQSSCNSVRQPVSIEGIETMVSGLLRAKITKYYSISPPLLFKTYLLFFLFEVYDVYGVYLTVLLRGTIINTRVGPMVYIKTYIFNHFY